MIMQINTHKYGHGEMRNKKLVNRGNEIILHSSAVLNKSPWKRKGKKGKKSKKKVITTRVIRSWSPSQVLAPRNRA